MNETIGAANDIIDVLTKLVSAPASVIILVIALTGGYGGYRLQSSFISNITARERRYGKLKAIAVAHKAKSEGISPEDSLLKINATLED